MISIAIISGFIILNITRFVTLMLNEKGMREFGHEHEEWYSINRKVK